MDYSEKSRPEELEELEGNMREAHQNYADQKVIYNQFRKNPFSVGQQREDIGPFKEYMKRHKVRVEDEVKELERMHDEENAMLDQEGTPQDMKQLLDKYRAMGIKISDQLTDSQANGTKDRTVLKDIFAFMQGQKEASVIQADKTSQKYKSHSSRQDTTNPRTNWSKRPR